MNQHRLQNKAEVWFFHVFFKRSAFSVHFTWRLIHKAVLAGSFTLAMIKSTKDKQKITSCLGVVCSQIAVGSEKMLTVDPGRRERQWYCTKLTLMFVLDQFLWLRSWLKMTTHREPWHAVWQTSSAWPVHCDAERQFCNLQGDTFITSNHRSQIWDQWKLNQNVHPINLI